MLDELLMFLKDTLDKKIHCSSPAHRLQRTAGEKYYVVFLLQSNNYSRKMLYLKFWLLLKGW